MKIDRADELIISLSREIDSYLDQSKTYLETKSVDESVWIISLHIPDEIPQTWSVTLGEIVHNLRSCLDNTFYEKLGAKFPADFRKLNPWALKKITFPIFTQEEDYRKMKWSGKIGGQALCEALLQFQPFRLKEFAKGVEEENRIFGASPLFQLHDLWNQDKHRGLVLMLGTVNMITLGLDFDQESSWTALDPWPWKGGSNIFKIELTKASKSQKLNLSYDFAVGLHTDALPLNVYPIINKLKAISSHVKYVRSALIYEIDGII